MSDSANMFSEILPASPIEIRDEGLVIIFGSVEAQASKFVVTFWKFLVITGRVLIAPAYAGNGC